MVFRAKSADSLDISLQAAITAHRLSLHLPDSACTINLSNKILSLLF